MRILVFDVNETLLNLRGMEAVFESVLDDPGASRAWFGHLMRRMLVTTITGPYVPFDALGREALVLTAASRGTSVTDADQERVAQAMRMLPPHAEVEAALKRLAASGRRLVALSNGVPDALHDQLVNAGLYGYFDAVLSADAAGRLKPAAEPYRMTADHLGVSTSDLRLIAAHPWDVTGAHRAGCATAFVARPGKRLAASDVQPDVIGEDLAEVAEQLIERGSGGNEK